MTAAAIYRRLRLMNVRAAAAFFVAKLAAEFKSPVTESDFSWLAANARNTGYTPYAYLPRAERSAM